MYFMISVISLPQIAHTFFSCKYVSVLSFANFFPAVLTNILNRFHSQSPILFIGIDLGLSSFYFCFFVGQLAYQLCNIVHFVTFLVFVLLLQVDVV
jgi:hypothetical protein